MKHKKKLTVYDAYMRIKWTKREKQFYGLGWSHGYAKHADELRQLVNIRTKACDT